jgi:hypothetical protein
MPTPSGDQSTGGQIPFFLQNVLSTPAGALPKGAQWVLRFLGDTLNTSGKPDYKGIIPVNAIKAGVGYEPNAWQIQNALDIVVNNEAYQTTKGCMFAQAVQIPGEGNQVNAEGIMQNGFLRSMVGAGREAYNGMQIVFLETNVSFVDNVIRPWTIATSHLGMIARKGDLNYRSTIQVWKLGVTDPSAPPVILQEYLFYGACPITIDGEEYNYSPTSTAINRNTTFTYHYYTLNSHIDNGYNRRSDVTVEAINSTPNLLEEIIGGLTNLIIPFNFITPIETPVIPAFNVLTENIQPVIRAVNKKSVKNTSLTIDSITDRTRVTDQPVTIETVNSTIPADLPPNIVLNLPTTLPPNAQPVTVTPQESTTVPPQPFITPVENTTVPLQPVITPRENTIIPLQFFITPSKETQPETQPVIQAKSGLANLNALAKNNIVNVGIPSKAVKMAPIILQTSSRADAVIKV